MLNIDKVYTSKWMLKDSVRNYVIHILSNLPSSVDALTDAQKSAIINELDTAKTGNYEPTAPFMDFQENNGVVIPDTPTCTEIATDYYQAALGEDIDTTSQTHVGRMIEQSALILKSAIGFTAANVMQTDLNSATGRYLDALGALFFSSRKSAAATSATVTFTNSTSSAITLLASSCSFTDGNGVTFNLSADATLPAQSGDTPGSVTCTFVCEDTGEIPLNTDSISWTKPTDATVSGLPSNVTLGYDVESDDDYRTRLKSTRVSSVGFLASVKSALLSLDGVYDALVLENTANATATISGVPMAAHSILTYVDYDGTDATTANIAKAIFERKAIGCGYTTGLISGYGEEVEEDVTDEVFGTNYTVTFYKPKTVAVDVKIYVSSNEYSGTSLASDIKKAIVAWVNGDVPYVDGIKIGSAVKAYEIGAAVSVRIPEIQIDNVQVKKHTDGTYANKVTMSAYQIATISESNIDVHIDEVD